MLMRDPPAVGGQSCLVFIAVSPVFVEGKTAGNLVLQVRLFLRHWVWNAGEGVRLYYVL